jgi:hypothetical protein
MKARRARTTTAPITFAGGRLPDPLPPPAPGVVAAGSAAGELAWEEDDAADDGVDAPGTTTAKSPKLVTTAT